MGEGLLMTPKVSELIKKYLANRAIKQELDKEVATEYVKYIREFTQTEEYQILCTLKYESPLIQYHHIHIPDTNACIKTSDEALQVLVNIYEDIEKTRKMLPRILKEEIHYLNKASKYALDFLKKVKAKSNA